MASVGRKKPLGYRWAWDCRIGLQNSLTGFGIPDRLRSSVAIFGPTFHGARCLVTEPAELPDWDEYAWCGETPFSPMTAEQIAADHHQREEPAAAKESN